MPVLIYIKTNGRVSPQILHQDHTTGSGTAKFLGAVQEQLISAQEALLPFSELTTRYPYKEQE